MRIGDLKISKLQILILIILFVGIIVGVILVQRQQIFKSRAYDIRNSFEVTDPDGNQLNCSGTSCDTKSLDVKVKIKDLNSLIEN